MDEKDTMYKINVRPLEQIETTGGDVYLNRQSSVRQISDLQ